MSLSCPALAKYEKGVKLLTRCHSLLDQAEHSVALLTGVDNQGNPLTAPFDASATVAHHQFSDGRWRNDHFRRQPRRISAEVLESNILPKISNEPQDDVDPATDPPF